MEKGSFNRWSRKRKLQAKMELARVSRKQRTSCTVSSTSALSHTRVDSREEAAPSHPCLPEESISESMSV